MGIGFFAADLRAASGSKRFIPNLKWAIFNHSAHLVFFYRLGQSAATLPIVGHPMRFFIEYFIRIVFSSDLSCRSKIGPGLVVVHGHDIVIGADVKIGKNCKIFNGVTLGNKDITKSSVGNQPTLGDNSVLSTGAKILGPVTLGENIVVGANSVVLQDFPDNSVVVGIPAKVVRNRSENQR
ncbi:serine O-acetyltransferase [uncultured Massilia sp.]|uniref:serine O-acetyltransferase n=1 Tax=uncultured Massilia sp. TaxID=169973 RepID=UPI0025E04BA2|nr:DapH/DapD/GlmU-related protein [uncultured Massilia sp.]